MSISSLVVASLPIPVTAFKLIPTYAAHTKILSVYTPLFCFLILGFIFYIRHYLARAMFPDLLETKPSLKRPEEPDDTATEKQKRKYDYAIGKYRWTLARYSARRRRNSIRRFAVNSLPLICIIGALLFVYLYHVVLELSANQFSGGSTFDEVLAHIPIDRIPLGNELIIIYIGIFVTAEAAFILMAIKEYIQDLMGFNERELIMKSYT
jgi:hypothetical protein